jgi:hypothetical protein
VLGFVLYVLPSTSYRKEFDKTWMGKKLSPWMFKTKTMKTVVKKKPKKPNSDLIHRVLSLSRFWCCYFDIQSDLFL